LKSSGDIRPGFFGFQDHLLEGITGNINDSLIEVRGGIRNVIISFRDAIRPPGYKEDFLKL